MPWLPLYADRQDVKAIVAFLNEDTQAAFIVPDGPRRWKAVERVDALADGRHCIWCHLGGSLPLIRPKGLRDPKINDPWAGWTEEVKAAEDGVPYFGAGHPAVVWFNVRTKGARSRGIGLSSFEWIGNHYRVIGHPAPRAVEKWWQRLKRQVAKSGKRIPRTGAPNGPGAERWALPSAYERIASGTPRDDDPI